jgi:hypothetical protein
MSPKRKTKTWMIPDTTTTLTFTLRAVAMTVWIKTSAKR